MNGFLGSGKWSRHGNIRINGGIKNMNKLDNQIIIFKTNDEKISVGVRFGEDTAWLTQQQIAELFDTSRTNVVEHIKHIYSDGELIEEATCRKFRQVRTEGGRQVARTIPYSDVRIAKNYLGETVDNVSKI
jgi:hypothetical protein